MGNYFETILIMMTYSYIQHMILLLIAVWVFVEELAVYFPVIFSVW